MPYLSNVSLPVYFRTCFRIGGFLRTSNSVRYMPYIYNKSISLIINDLHKLHRGIEPHKPLIASYLQSIFFEAFSGGFGVDAVFGRGGQAFFSFLPYETGGGRGKGKTHFLSDLCAVDILISKLKPSGLS